MGFMDWLRRLLGESEKDEGALAAPPPTLPTPPAPAPAPQPGAPVATARPVAPPVPPVPGVIVPPPRPIDLNAADFLPIGRDELREAAQDVRRGGAWFGRRDLIPPAEDPRTKLIDRAMVTHGLLTPEQLAEIHRVGAEMERL